MSYLETNSTDAPLLANGVYIGKSTKIDPKYITLQISIKTDKEGLLEVYHSYDGKTFDTYGDSISISEAKHIQYSIKGSYIYVKYTNGNENQTKFLLHSKLSIQPRENMNVQLNYLEDSVSIPALESALTQVEGETYQNVLLYGKNQNNLVEPVKITSNKVNILDDRLNFDASGNLKTVNSSTSTQDVNITNENLNVTEANSQDILDSLQSFTDNVTFNTNKAIWVAVNDVLNPIQVENKTGNKLDVYDASNNSVLGDIKTDLDKFKFTQTGSDLYVHVSNGLTVSSMPDISGNVHITNDSLPVTGTFWQQTQPISGSVTISSMPDISGNVTVSNFPTSTQVQNVTGTALDVHCYGSANGNSHKEISVDNNGLVNTNLHSSGTSITNTNGSLNANITNTVGVSGTVSANISGSISNTSFKSQLQDNSGNGISATGTSLNVNCTNNISGYSTSANQSTMITSLNSLVTDLSGNSYTTNRLNVYDASGNASLTTLVNDLSGNSYTTNRLNVYDASGNTTLTTISGQTNKLSFDASNNLYVLNPRTLAPNYGCFYFSVSASIAGGAFSNVFCDTATGTLAGTNSTGLFTIGSLSYIPKDASVTIGITHASQGASNMQLVPAGSDASGNYSTNGYAIGAPSTASSAYQLTQCGTWTYPKGVPRYISFYNNSSSGSISGVKVSISFIY